MLKTNKQLILSDNDNKFDQANELIECIPGLRIGDYIDLYSKEAVMFEIVIAKQKRLSSPNDS